MRKNFGVWTELSKSVNRFFGDNSGRTVSRRTAQGMKEVFNRHDINDRSAEKITHVGMIATLGMILSRNKDVRNLGFIMLFVLIGVYLIGK